MFKQGFSTIPAIVKRLKQQNKCYELFSNGVFGHLLNLKYKEFPARIMHQLLLRITSFSEFEISFRIGKEIVKFGLEEFAIVSGLNCEPFENPPYKENEDGNSFKDIHFGDCNVINLSTIAYVYEEGKDKNDEDLVKLANLFFLEQVLLPKDNAKAVDSHHVKLLTDLDEFYLYPWGRVIFMETIKSVSSALNTMSRGSATGYHLGGFPLAILAFAFEIIPQLRELQFIHASSIRHPQRVLNWVYTSRANFEQMSTQIFDNEGVCNIKKNKIKFVLIFCLGYKFSYIYYIMLHYVT